MFYSLSFTFFFLSSFFRRFTLTVACVCLPVARPLPPPNLSSLYRCWVVPPPSTRFRLSVQNREQAYHHGIMLISTRLDTLGEVLWPGKDKETMETKGIASVRSPVWNLQHYHPAITLQGFVDAVVWEFLEEYGIGVGVGIGQDGD
ncbi:hypothetical protein GYMLUDRAFT_399130 [Collybiopsis luxurians FD-317 M1]|nr:hypothetical protein GYMLUDRAFT_399130 [Collybiopsis luxurians FD-317 M1]